MTTPAVFFLLDWINVILFDNTILVPYAATAIPGFTEPLLFWSHHTAQSPARPPPSPSFQNQRYLDQTRPFLHDHRHHFPSRIKVIWTKPDHSYTTTAITVFPESTLFWPNQTIHQQDHCHHGFSWINVILIKPDLSYTTTAITVFPESTLFFQARPFTYMTTAITAFPESTLFWSNQTIHLHDHRHCHSWLVILIKPDHTPTRPPPLYFLTRYFDQTASFLYTIYRHLPFLNQRYFDHTIPLRALHDHRRYFLSWISVILIKPDHFPARPLAAVSFCFVESMQFRSPSTITHPPPCYVSFNAAVSGHTTPYARLFYWVIVQVRSHGNMTPHPLP